MRGSFSLFAIVALGVVSCNSQNAQLEVIGTTAPSITEATGIFREVCVNRVKPNQRGFVHSDEDDSWYHKTHLVTVKIHADDSCTMAFGSKAPKAIVYDAFYRVGAEEVILRQGEFEGQSMYFAADRK